MRSGTQHVPLRNSGCFLGPRHRLLFFQSPPLCSSTPVGTRREELRIGRAPHVISASNPWNGVPYVRWQNPARVIPIGERPGQHLHIARHHKGL